MRTPLPNNITSIEEAETFLRTLVNNKEHYHPEDNAHHILFNLVNEKNQPTFSQCEQLNKLMEQIYTLNGFDPCEFIIKIS